MRGPDSCLNETCDLIRQVAPYDVNVLVTGESGTGKELCARALHYNSLRQDKPFVAENCGAMPDELLESELFGHKKGAFSGAVEDRRGLFETADGGTIFLDEIGDTSPAFQVKLLRVLQEGEVRPVGSNKRIPVDVRVIAATHHDLEEEVRRGEFRQDLYYRLATFKIPMPPLRQRRTDIAPLTVALLEQAIDQLGKRVRGISEEALECLRNYDWPGNVRELQNEIKRMLVLAQDDYLGADLISPHILRAEPEKPDLQLDELADMQGSLKERVEALEARILRETLIRPPLETKPVPPRSWASRGWACATSWSATAWSATARMFRAWRMTWHEQAPLFYSQTTRQIVRIPGPRAPQSPRRRSGLDRGHHPDGPHLCGPGSLPGRTRAEERRPGRCSTLHSERHLLDLRCAHRVRHQWAGAESESCPVGSRGPGR